MNAQQQSTIRHPHHEQIAMTIRNWFHNPMHRAGCRAEVRKLGTYWEHGAIYPNDLTAKELPDFLTSLCKRYANNTAAQIIIDKAEMACTIGPRLVEANWQQDTDTIFLTHVGVFPGRQLIPGLSISPIDEVNLTTCARVCLRTSADYDKEPNDDRLDKEVVRLRNAMTHNGCGLLASINDEAVGLLWCYEDLQDVWVSQLAVRQPFRQQGVAHALLKQRVASAYSAGFRSVVINVQANNDRAVQFLKRVGFCDEVVRQQRYRRRLETGVNRKRCTYKNNTHCYDNQPEERIMEQKQ
ncbi:MAG: GNAT family N-acetyltransferase [Chloroflexota bacterium]